MPGGPHMLETLIIATLVLGSASLAAWLFLGDRPAGRPAARRPEVSGRVVGAIGVSSGVIDSRAGAPGGVDGAERTAAPALGEGPGLGRAEAQERPLAAGGH